MMDFLEKQTKTKKHPTNTSLSMEFIHLTVEIAVCFFPLTKAARNEFSLLICSSKYIQYVT